MSSTPAPAATVSEALQRGKFVTDEIPYSFLQLPPSRSDIALSLLSSISESDNSFRGLLVDKDEITLMVRKDAVSESDQNGVHQASTDYRLITFDVVLDPNLVGFMNVITGVLAKERISVLPFAAYSRDHIFIQEPDFERAMSALKTLQSDYAKK